MKVGKILLGIAVALAVGFGFVRFFVSELTSGEVRSDPPGVILAPPPDVAIEELGAVDRMQAAHHLATLMDQHRGEDRFGVHFRTAEHELYWIVDRSDPTLPVLIERAAGAGGTRVEMRWQGELDQRVAWAQQHGTFEAPGLTPGEPRNLYH